MPDGCKCALQYEKKKKSMNNIAIINLKKYYAFMIPDFSSSLEEGFLEVKCEMPLSNGVQKSQGAFHSKEGERRGEFWAYKWPHAVGVPAQNV